MTLYETIFSRRAVRKYDKAPLDGETLQKIKDFLSQTVQLNGCEARFEFVDGSAVTDGKAPHYILAYAEKNPVSYINVGYVLQAVDLYIQSLELGSVWLGMPKPSDKAATADYCIMLAFGKTEEPMRFTDSEFKRLPLTDISNDDNEIARAARLAPSAVNSQPWFLRFHGAGVIIEYKGRGLLKNILKTKMSPVDLGIVTRHVVTTAENEGKTIKSVTPKGDGKSFSVEILFE